MRVRTTSISCKQSAKFLSTRSLEVYLVPKTAFIFVLLVGEEGVDPRSGPIKNGDCKGNLGFITWIGELGVVDYPERNVELNQLLFIK